MAQRYQQGHLRRAKRKRGPDVWEFLWRECSPDGRRRQRTLTIGNVKELQTERDALNHIQNLRANINREVAPTALMTFGDLVNHYRQTELLAENKTDKTRTTYLVYLRKWILPEWEREYLHNIKPVVVEQWLRSLGELSNGSKAKIRNIMSGLFSHAIGYEMADRNPITAVRQSSKRERIPVILEVEELHRLFGELALRERAMIVCDALTGMRRSELMGLQWHDLDFIGRRINIVRSVVDQAIGKCKTEASRKPVSWMSTLCKPSSRGDRRALTRPRPIGFGLRRRWQECSRCGFRLSCDTTSSRRRDAPASTRKSAGTLSGTRSRL
jgi:integrase